MTRKIDLPLSEAEMSVLSNGLKFVPLKPSVNKYNVIHNRQRFLSVLWHRWQSLVILRNVKLTLTMIFLLLCFKLPSTENLGMVHSSMLVAISTSAWLKYATIPSKKIQPHTWWIHCSPKERWHCHKTSRQRRRSCCVGQETIHKRSVQATWQPHKLPWTQQQQSTTITPPPKW